MIKQSFRRIVTTTVSVTALVAFSGQAYAFNIDEEVEKVVSKGVSSSIQDRVSSFLGSKGAAAQEGSGASTTGAFAALSRTTFKFTGTSGVGATKGRINVLVAGGDKAFANDKFIAGATANLVRGSFSGATKISGTGLNVFGAAILNDNFWVDLKVGRSATNVKTAGVSVSSTSIASAVSVNYTNTFDQADIVVGLSRSRSSSKSAGTTTTSNSVKANMELGYQATDAVRPYIAYSRSRALNAPAGTNDSQNAGFGADWEIQDNMTLTAGYDRALALTDTTIQTGKVNLRIDF